MFAWFFSILLYYHKTILINLLYQHIDTKRNPRAVLYTHIAQLMTHTTIVYTAAAYLSIMLYKPFSILQRVIKSQRVYISERSLSKKRLVKFFILVKLKCHTQLVEQHQTAVLKRHAFPYIGYSLPFLKDPPF